MTGYDSELLERRLGWMRAGTAYFEEQLRMVEDKALEAPSNLEGWSKAHVASHIARNAEALMNLLDWARSGVEHRMYESPSHRQHDIATGSLRPAQEIRADVLATARRLDSEVAAMSPAEWSAPVRTAADRPIAAAEVPFMRVREVFVHGVDLGAGGSFSEIPAEVCEALVEDAMKMFNARKPPDNLAVSIRLSGSPRSYGYTGWAGERLPEVSGSAQDVAAWLLGRSGGTGLETTGGLPPVPRWL